ncbi:MAG: ATP-binding protein [Cyanobacteria bacterium J06626_4]
MTLFPDNSAFAVRQLSFGTYHRLRRSFLSQAQQTGAIGLTEADLSAAWETVTGWQTVALVVTPTTQGLLVQNRLSVSAWADSVELFSVGLATGPDCLKQAINSLVAIAATAEVQQQLNEAQQLLSDRSAESCAELMMTLLPQLIEPSNRATEVSLSAIAPAAPAPAQLVQKREQALLVKQIIAKIRDSLDLPAVLSTTVAEVQQYLAADRLVIYQFQAATAAAPSPWATSAPESTSGCPGSVTYEALAAPTIESVLHLTEERCLDDYAQCSEKYQDGVPIAVSDVQTHYRDTPCLLNFLQKIQVRAQVIAPIIVQNELWGFLIAHQCRTPRRWQPSELTFLQQIAEHLAIAIQQAELYAQLRSQTQSLETCVINRTQDLKDALAAAQSANFTKSEFLATMSHELRTPLTCIIGMSATLLRWSLGELNARQRTYLQTIHDSGERLLVVINNILEMSKIESGRIVLEVRTFSLTSLSQQAIEPFRKLARDRSIFLNFESTLLPDQDTFTGDPRRIQQILSNLLSNALKFTHDGGQVNLRLRREQQMAIFQVEDTGIGIPEHQISRLFETFQQLEPSRQRQYPGTGLGLALTKQLIELHGGSITVNSRVGVGSVFTARLPLQRLAAEAHPKPQPPAVPAAKATPVTGRIVLVEDQEDTAGVICDLLTAADYQVIWMIEGSRVVEQVALLQPAVVIINMDLGSINGRRVVEALREALITSKVKILALRSRQDSQDSLNDVDASITLPLEPEWLLEKVNALIWTTTF